MSTSITLNCVYNLYAEYYILKQCLTDDTLPQCLVQQINILIWFFWNYLLFWPTLWVLKGLSASRLLVHTQIQKHKRHRPKQVQWISSRSEVMMKMEVFFFHQQWPSNPPPTSKPWSSDSSNHKPLKMSLSSENGSMEKSIKGFNVVSLPWLPRLLSVIHQITLSHSPPPPDLYLPGQRQAENIMCNGSSIVAGRSSICYQY